MTPILTKRKKQLLDCIKAFQLKHGYFPTLEEISRKLKLRSVATVHQHLSELEQLGMLQRGFGRARDMRLLSNDSIASTVAEPYLAGSSLALPVAGLITAGQPIEAIETGTETMTVPRQLVNNNNAYVLRVKGDSMIESLIADGDYVVVQKQDYAMDGDIVVALLEDGSATLKEFHKEKNYIRLQPRNPQYKPIRVRHVIIQGKVLGIIRQFNNV
ncbi:MAG: transcriptional repressor LexA [Candidatus Kerfeldbacteria bacterium]|nr:transcriptional repressor LexA [Candidatus Kerfeldbacteria bacterium]